MSFAKVTPWFRGTETVPGQVGVYERHLAQYSFWDGKVWRGFCPTPAQAAKEKMVSAYQHLDWRGLVSKPK